MLKIVTENNASTITGSRHELLFVYMIWKSVLWPSWWNEEELGDQGDQLTEEIIGVLKKITLDEKLEVFNPMNDTDDCHKALMKALSTCRKIGIEIK